MEPEQTLRQLLTDRVSVFAPGDRPKAIIDEHVEAMFKEVIKRCFESYGDFGKAVRESVASALPANVSNMFELTRYNSLIAAALREKWASVGVEGDMVRRAQDAIDEIMKEDAVPAVVSLRDLLEKFADANKESAAEGHWEAPRIDIKVSDDERTVRIHFDPEPDQAYSDSYFSKPKERSSYLLKNAIAIMVTGKNEKGHMYGRVYSARIDETPVRLELSLYQPWERLLAALYYGAAELVIDCDADDITYGLYD